MTTPQRSTPDLEDSEQRLVRASERQLPLQLNRVKAAILSSGNIGADLMVKMINGAQRMELVAMACSDPLSRGLELGKSLGVEVTAGGIGALKSLPIYSEIGIVFDATSASAHALHDAVLRADGKQVVDLTPAAIGPFTVPSVNMGQHLDQPNVNMVTWCGQAAIPIVAAVNRASKVRYAEMTASVALRATGPRTRDNIAELIRTTARVSETVGGAMRARAVIELDPAEPPVNMRVTVFTVSDDSDEAAIRAAVEEMVRKVQIYVPGYRLKQDVQFERFGENSQLEIPDFGELAGIRSSVFLEIEGNGEYLPAYSGNVDVMTAAAKATGERLAEQIAARSAAA